MFRRHGPAGYKHMLVSDSETESDDNLSSVAVTVAKDGRRAREEEEGERSLSTHQRPTPSFKSKQSLDPEGLLEVAKEYQKKMEKKSIPRERLKEMVVVNWRGLAKTMKTLYGQPLHYLTEELCKEWDKSRIGSKNEEKALNSILSWREAEETVWKVEAVHRLCTSPVHLALLWLHDPQYHLVVDQVISTSSSSTSTK
ncbi:protein RDM1-like [Vigna radiata var. radiata]|uniref:Protein RDM1-like n=1 Tax=Vigna radiata var. radiata TaxID=3916 RepID=A0A3Q0EVV4_VIGRR|nr:protein RDM1-like [Vigna radiata var. radiata]